jgi:cytidine deaminase
MIDLDELIKVARDARTRAYAPYSRYHVGAAVLGDNGNIYWGANVENASYGLALCAERVAIAQAILDGAKSLKAAAVVTSTSPPAAPCGACRQSFAEFALDLPLVLVNDAGERVETALVDLLPRAFRANDLPK